MKRQSLILVALGAVLVLAVFWMFLWQPQREALADVEAAIAAEQATQAQLQGELARLRAAREQAPEAAAELAVAESVIPSDAAVPSALRQLQVAADASNITLVAVAPARPVQIEGAEPGVASMALNVQLRGSYFQVIDFLRRVEDASISPRAVLWSNIAVTKDEYPTLDIALTGNLFAQLPTPPPPVVDPPPAAEGEAVDEGAEDTDAASDGTETTEVAP